MFIFAITIQQKNLHDKEDSAITNVHDLLSDCPTAPANGSDKCCTELARHCSVESCYAPTADDWSGIMARRS